VCSSVKGKTSLAEWSVSLSEMAKAKRAWVPSQLVGYKHNQPGNRVTVGQIIRADGGLVKATI